MHDITLSYSILFTAILYGIELEGKTFDFLLHCSPTLHCAIDVHVMLMQFICERKHRDADAIVTEMDGKCPEESSIRYSDKAIHEKSEFRVWFCFK
jgi:hypothetical protein